jgi:hypothetical protein
MRQAVRVLRGAACVLAVCTSSASASVSAGPPPAQATAARAVVVVQGGGAPHPYSTPWSACAGGRPAFVQALVDAGLPVFTAPGYSNTQGSTAGESGCPAQPPLEVQWNTSAYPAQAGQSVLGFLGWLNATYGYRTFDLVGYSYGGLVGRATVAALKQRPAPGAMAPGFSYAQSAVDAGVSIPSLITMNSPHFGSPTYDVALDPAAFTRPVLRAWGRQFADAGAGLRVFQTTEGAGAIQVLSTTGHTGRDPRSWDAAQVGMLDGVAVTLVAGDYCGQVCAPVGRVGRAATNVRLRTDGTVPVYSQLMQPCPRRCPAPPGSVAVLPGLLPSGVVRKTFPTVHSSYDAKRLKLPTRLSVSSNPRAIAYVVNTQVSRWRAAGVPLLTP